jgi:hypothetical protein
MQTWGLLALALLVITIPAYAQVSNPQIGNNTSAQYCWTGTCITSHMLYNGTITGNDTSHNELRAQYNIIMIIPSELCTRAIENHVKTDCPLLQNLIKYDNSNQKISGYFYSIDGKTLDRSNPQVKNHWQYYWNTNHTIVCVYCTGNYLTTDLYKTIILSPVSFEYATHNFLATPYNIAQYNDSSGNFTNIKYYQNEIDVGLTTVLNRQVLGCNTATIAYSDFLLNDTINYLESGCTKTNYNMTKIYSHPNSPWSYDNPYSSQHYMSALKQMTNGHGIYGTNQTVGGHGPGNCINGCTYTTSTKKPGW